jgi:hypothetical protein
MIIFDRERKDGLAEKLEASSSLSFELLPDILNTSSANVSVPDLEEISKNRDLLYFNSILASVGWNKNDDVFDAKEMWRARGTPVNKKINYMHDEKDIIGHMTNSNVIDFHGNYISNDISEENIPEAFDIVVGGYIYKHWQDGKLVERMAEILEKVNKQELAVSMECIFPTFDYAIITPDGEHRFIARSDDTAFLTKHLRIYGGSGSYEGFKVGRLLRNMIFTGNALVDRPANPRSLILKKDSVGFTGSLATINIFNKPETNMADVITKEAYDALEKRLEAAEAAAKEASKKELDSFKEINEKLSAEAKKLNDELKVALELSKAHEATATGLSEKIKTLETELADAKSKLDSYNKEMCKSKRKAAMAEVNVENADAFVEKFADVSDELFDELVKAMPKKAVAKVEDKPTETTTASVKEILDKAEDKDTTVTIPSDATTKYHSEASEWFASILSNKETKGE